MDFDIYLQQTEGDCRERAANWQTAIGLQAVDGLKTSEYLLETARQHIEGKIDIDEAGEMLRTYYQSKTQRTPDDDETQEADLVSRNIAKILGTRTLQFSTEGYIAVHRKVFDGVFKFAGRLRDYDITKREWVLKGDKVNYLPHQDLRSAIDYDLKREREFSYKGLSKDDTVGHICRFVSGLWQIHAFSEGNTRTTAVFVIQYLRSIGFEVCNDMFAHHSWYFRNALVRANYKNAQFGVDYTFTFLERFFRNLLMGEHHDLRNCYMHLDYKATEQATEQATVQVTEQATVQVKDLWHTDNEFISKLIMVIGHEQLSVKEMLDALQLKHRMSFVETYLLPAISEGYVTMLYPDKPKHPRQKYLFTVKGTALFNERTS